MWTPRRVLLLLFGMVLFGTAFGVYARVLGWIDGLPQLPEEFLVRRADNEPFSPPSPNPIQQRLQLAFPGGGRWHEVYYNHKIELRPKGIVLAFNECNIEDGRVKLTPFSLAAIRERTGEFPEVNTVHADVCYLEFDKPVKTISEIGGRRIVACQLESDRNAQTDDPRGGKVHVTNNRSTPALDDDLCLETPGPVQYREAPQPDLPLDKAKPQIVTRTAVRLTDKRNQPQATTVDAQGMLVYLAVEPPDSSPAAAKGRPRKRSQAVNGVRRVVLPRDVSMSLWMDPKDGFLATGADREKPAAGNVPAERTNVRITTLGPFTYDVLPDADRARFDRLPPAETQLPSNCVRIVRPQSRGPHGLTYDQLECDALELQFPHASLPSPAPAGQARPPKAAADATRPAAIDWIHAWGQQVLMTSDDENLVASGTDLFHDAHARTTTLKGSPEMVAVKDGNEIHAPELVISGPDAKVGQQAVAKGAGHARVFDRTGAARPYVARWREQCVYRKDGGQDLLVLTGGATFEDPAADRKLSADQLKLWLAPDPTPSAPAAKAPAGSGSRPGSRPKKLEALGHVSARSLELTVNDTQELVLLFTEAPPRPNDKPQATAYAPSAPGGHQAGKVPLNAPPGPAVGATKPAPSQPARRPIALSARSVQAFLVVRGTEPPQLNNVHCEGNVRVHQDPQAPQDKPVKMQGNTLRLTYKPEGSVLFVTGTPDAPGLVQLPDLSLLGPKVLIDQVENVAEVQGIGSMCLASKTDLQGNKLREPSDLIITWSQRMHFNGQLAHFHGHVQADQGNTTLLCENMQVYLNQPVVLNQRPGESKRPGAEPAAVDRVVCDSGSRQQGVSITESESDSQGVLVRYQRIDTDGVSLYKEEGRMVAGPFGNVRILRIGPKGDPLAVLPAPPAAGARSPASPSKPTGLEHKLTWVRFGNKLDGQMQVKQIDGSKHTVKFFKSVQVLYLPVDPTRVPADMDELIDKLPPGALYLSCEKLTALSAKDSQGRTHQEMHAEDRAEVQWGNEFYGRADIITFDEKSQKVTLRSLGGNLVLVEKLRPGTNQGAIRRGEVIYDRLNDHWHIVGQISAGNQ